MEPSGTFVPFFLLPHLFFSLAAAGRCTPALGAGTHLVDLNSGGLERRFLLDVPAGVDVGAGLPALISMHGYSASPYYYSLLTGTARYNEDQHYDERHPTAAGSFEYLQRGYKWLVALPFGTAEKPSPHCCPANASDAACRGGTLLDQSNPCSWNAGGCCGTAPDRRVDDVGFVRAIASWLKSAMCADDDLFAMGFSNGAMMANRLGCEAADLFRGIAPVEGGIELGGGFAECRPSRAVSVVQICGAADGVCNTTIGPTMATWAAAAGCALSTTPTYESATSHCRRYVGCAAGAFVEWCMVDGLAHEFSGHLRPGSTARPPEKDFGYQPATNIDGFRYVMNRFSTLLKPKRPHSEDPHEAAI